MLHNEVSRFIWTSVGLISVFAGLQIWLIDKGAFGLFTISRVLSAISIVLFFWSLFAIWLWQFLPFSLIAKRPVLKGTWGGHIYSKWSPEGEIDKETKIPIYFAIYQDFFKITIRSFTEGKEGITLSAHLIRNNDTHEFTIIYVYTLNHPFDSTMPVQRGAAIVRLVDNRLKGNYWTDTNSKGIVVVEFQKKKREASYHHASRTR